MADRIPERVFVSYSRKDQDWLAKIEAQLGPLVRRGEIQPWIDRGRIEFGDQFTAEITEAIDTCSAAIILVSPHFQNSDFIQENELPRLLRHANAGKLRLYWVLLADCLLVDELGGYHAVNDSNLPLEAMSSSEVNSVLAQMARALRKHVRQMQAGEAIEPPEPDPSPISAENPLENCLGMKFVPVPGLDSVLFSVWQTRVQDYAAFAAENPGIDMEWKDYEYKGHKQGPDHPVINVSWEDAVAFCQWLSKKEGKTYRLPSDHEWSVAVGIGDREDPNASPEDKSDKLGEIYPWGTQWPPPENACNWSGEKRFPFTAPVGSFALEHHGIKDLSGNVWEWCQDWYDNDHKYRVLRGGSWGNGNEVLLRSSYRHVGTPSSRFNCLGFRCVLEVGSGG